MKKARIFTTLALTAAMVSNMMFPSIILAETITDETDETEVITEESTATEATETSEITISEPTDSEPTETDPTEPSDTSETVIEETVETTETEETFIEVTSAAFDQQVTVGNTLIRVIADEGVFPDNSTLYAEEVEYGDLNNDQSQIVAQSYTFDICIFDENGNEVEPDGDVQILFENSLISDENLDTTVYHEEVELGYEMVEDDCIVATTDGFSYYTVEFTYNTLEFELACETDTELSAILTTVGLTGTPTNCVSSTDKIYVSTINDEYWITSVDAFNTTETLTVTINDIDYVINVICDEHAPETATAGVDAYAFLYASGRLVIQKGNTPIASEGEVVVSGLINADASELPWADHEREVSQVYFRDNLVGMASLKNFFAGMTNIDSLDLSRLDSSDATSFSGMFNGCTSLHFEDVNLEALDRSSVTDISAMFVGCDNLYNINLTGWVTSQVTTASGLFSGCDNIHNIFIDNWDLAGMTGTNSMSGMLSVSSSTIYISCKNWQNIPSNFSNGFGRTIGVPAAVTVGTLDVTGWDLSETTNILGLFANLRVNEIIGLDSWNTENITNMNQLFYACTLSDYSDVYGWNVSNVTDLAQMFGSSNAVTLDLSNWDTHNVTVFAQGSFIGPNTTTLILDNWDFSGINSFLGNGFLGNTVLTTLSMRNCTNIPNFTGTDSIGRAMSGGGCHFNTIDVTGWDLSRCTSLNGVFANITVDNLVGYETWDTSHIQNFSQVFCYTKGLTDIDISAWDFSSATTVSNMFSEDANNTIESVKLPASFTSNFALSDTAIQSISQAFRVGDTVSLVEDFTTSNQVAGVYTPVNITVLDPHQGTLTMPSNRLLGTNDTPVFLWDDTYHDTLPDENAIVRTNYTFFGWEDSEGTVYTDASTSFPATLIAKWDNYTPQTATAGVDLYRIVYNQNGAYITVYQKGNEIDPDMGTVVSNPALVSANNQRIYTFITNGEGTLFIKDYIVGFTGSFGFSTSQNGCTVHFQNLDYIDTSLITRLGSNNAGSSTNSSRYAGGLFYGICYADGLEGIADWNTSNVTDMSYLFSNVDTNCIKLPDSLNWDISNVANMSYMFQYSTGDFSCVENWNTSNVTNFNHLCYSAKWFHLLPLRNWNVSAATNLNYAFNSMTNLVTVAGLETWTPSSCTNFSYMFAGDTDLTSIYNLAWDMTSASNLAHMFEGCTKLRSIEGLSGWQNLGNATNFNSLFLNDAAITSLAGLENWDTSSVTDMGNAFSGLKVLTNVDPLLLWNTENVLDMSYTFYNTQQLRNVDGLQNWNVSKVTTMAYMFGMAGASSATSRRTMFEDGSGFTRWTTSSLTNMDHMFWNLGITDLTPLAGWDVSHVTTMKWLFAISASDAASNQYQYLSANYIDSLEPLANWHTENVTDMSGIFLRQSRLITLDGLDDWDVSSVTTFIYAFNNCTRLKNADGIANWAPTSNLQYVGFMFAGDNALRALDLSHWDMSGVSTQNLCYMFRYSSNGTNSLVEISIPESFPNYTPNGGYGAQPLDFTYPENWVREGDTTPQTYNLTQVLTGFTPDRAGTYYHSYNLTLYPMGGEVTPRRFVVMPNEDTVLELPTPERTGYTFDYWYDVDGNQYTDTITIPAGTVIKSLTAHWTAGTYTLILKPNNSRYGASLTDLTFTLPADEAFTLSEDLFEIPNRHITSWSTRSNGQGTVYDVNETVIGLAGEGETVTLYAQWAASADSDETITLNFHQINVLTGEETGIDEVTVPVDGDYQLFDHEPTVEHGRIIFCSYSDDLDAVHFDQTGLVNDEYTVYTCSDNNGTYQVPFNYLTAERANIWDYTHQWTEDEDGTDLYIYYMPSMQVRVHFGPQFTSCLPDELVMTYNGQEYRDGEYIIDCVGFTSNFVISSYDAFRGLYGGYSSGILSPDSWLSARCYSGFSIINQMSYSGAVDWNNTISYDTTTFNYDYITMSSNSLSSYLWANPYICMPSTSSTTNPITGETVNYTSWQFGWSHQRYALINYTGDFTTDLVNSNFVNMGCELLPDLVNRTYDVWMPLAARIHYVDSLGRVVTDTTYYSGSGYNPDLTQITAGIYNYYATPIPEGCVFDGIWTEAEGGTQLSTTHQERGFWSEPVNGIENNMTFYAHYREATPDDNLSYYHLYIHNDFARTPVTTRRIYVANYDNPIFANIKGNSSDRFDVEAEVLPYYSADRANKFFMGWFTEPNGQGEQVTYSTAFTDNMHIYAYWVDTYATVSFDLFSSDIHPTSTTNISMIENANGRFITGSVSTYTCSFDTVFTANMIPVVNAGATEMYNFIGWFTEPNGQGEQLVAGTVITEDITYYAYWESCFRTAAGAALNIDYNISWVRNPNATTLWTSNSSENERVRFTVTTDSDTVLPVGTVTITGAGNLGCGQYRYPQNGKYFGYKTTGYPDYASEYCLVNNREITGGVGIDANVSRSTYSTNSSYPVTITVDLDPNDGVVDVVITRTLYACHNGSSARTSFVNLCLVGEAQFEYPSNIYGNSISYVPDDADDYFYVLWKVQNTNTSRPTDIGGTFDFTGLNLIDVGNGGEVLMPDNAEFNSSTYDVMGNSIWVRYPRTMLDINTGRCIVNQSVSYFEMPAQTNLISRTQRLNGTAVLRWNDEATNEGTYDFMIGRGTTPYMPQLTARTIQQLTRAARPETSRNYITEVPTMGTGWSGVTNGMYWYVHERSTIQPGQSHAVGMRQGDLYYNSGAGEDYFMLNPQSGNYVLTDNDYFITAVQVQYQAMWREYVEETGTYDGDWTFDNYTDMQLEVWVRHAGSSEMELFTTINPNNSSAKVTQTIDLSSWGQLPGGSFGFSNTDIVDVQVRVTPVDAPCNISLTVCPNIHIKNNAVMHQYFVSDANQYTSSVFKMDGRIFNYNADGTLAGTYSFFGGWYNAYFDEDCLLDLYEITPNQLGDITWRVTQFNSGLMGTYDTSDIVVYNQSTTNADFRPIDSCELYLLAENEYTTLRVLGYNIIRTATSNQGSVNYTGTNNYNIARPDVNNPRNNELQELTNDIMTVEYIDNWNGTGRRMAIVRFQGISDWYTEDVAYNGIRISVDCDRNVRTLQDSDNHRLYYGYRVIGASTSTVGMYTNIIDPATFGSTWTRPRWTTPMGNPVWEVDADAREWAQDMVTSAPSNIIDDSFYYEADLVSDEAVTQFGFNSYVANGSGEYAANTTVFPGETFTSLISYGVDTDAGNREVSDIVINTKLDGLSTWVSATIPTVTNGAQTCTPDVWYCLTPNPDFEHIDAEHGWTQTEPVGSICYGVHFDYTTADDGTPYVVTSNQIITISIKEKNGNNREGTATIENTLHSVAEISSTGETINNDLTSVNNLTMEIPDLSIGITANPESGTAELPTIVYREDDLIYTTALVNNSDRTVQNIEVIEYLPAHVHYDLNNIIVGGRAINNNGGITNVSLGEDNVLRFTVKSLGGNSTLNIVVNAYVEDNVEYLLTNNAVINSYFDLELTEDQKIQSNTTYHKIAIRMVDPTGLNLTAGSELILTGLCACGLFALYELIERKRKHQKD